MRAYLIILHLWVVLTLPLALVGALLIGVMTLPYWSGEMRRAERRTEARR